MEERLAAFGLRIAPEKTAVLRFDGRLLQERGRPTEKPATFTFLGFCPLPDQDPTRDNPDRPQAERESARALPAQSQGVGDREQASTRPSAASAPGQDAQRPLPVLWAAPLRTVTDRREMASRKALVAGAAPSKSESEAALRLGNAEEAAVVQAPATTSDAGLGVTIRRAARPICSGEPDALIAHVGFRPGGG